jgi:hypothetical protein
MQDLVAGDLHITVEERVAEGVVVGVVLIWKGKSDDRHPARILGPYFAAILDHAADRASAVEMHFEELEHLNSSSIASVIRFIQDARARRLRLVLVYNQALKWQKLSFDALRVFVRGADDDLLELRGAAQR